MSLLRVSGLYNHATHIKQPQSREDEAGLCFSKDCGTYNDGHNFENNVDLEKIEQVCN